MCIISLKKELEQIWKTYDLINRIMVNFLSLGVRSMPMKVSEDLISTDLSFSR